jgi:CRISPR/Cas system-associated exonuclease Cas4 (RecB family)
MIVEKVLEAKQAKIKQWPVKSNRASELGHDCIKYLVLNRTRWQEKSIHDAQLQMIFDMGNAVESLVLTDLKEAGFTVVEQQRPFSWEEYNITGSIDAKIIVNERLYPLEIKSSAPNPFNSVNSAQDMFNHKYHYMRKYPAQLTLYMLMDGKDEGVFLFKNKSTGELKEIWMSLDYEFAESLIKKAETINKHIADGTLPEPIDYDENICGDCAFRHICLPDRIGKEIEQINDEELVELLTRYEALKESAKEYKQIDDRIGEIVKGKEKILAGDYYIEGKWCERTNYKIPDDLKEKYAMKSPYWRKSIARIE